MRITSLRFLVTAATAVYTSLLLSLIPGLALAAGGNAHSALASAEPVQDLTPAISLAVAALAALALSGGLLRRLRRQHRESPAIDLREGRQFIDSGERS